MTASGQHIPYDRQLFVFLTGEQMSIPHGHGNGLVTHELLQFHQRDLAGLCQPGSEGMSHGVQGDGVQAVAVFRCQTELSDCGLKAGGSFIKSSSLAGLLKDGFRRFTPVCQEHLNHIFRHTDENTLPPFLDDIEAAAVGIHILPAQFEDFSRPKAGSQGKQSHVMQLWMPLFEVVQKGFGFLSGQKTQSFIVGPDHLPCSALGGQRVDSAPCAGSDGTVYGGAHEAENVVDCLASQSFSGFCLILGLDAAPLFGFCIPGGCGEQLRLEIGEESRTQIGNRQIVNLSLEMGLVLAVVLVNVLPFASTPFKVGVHELTDCHIVAGSRVYTRDGDLGNEFCSFALDHWRTNTLAMPADGLPMTLALGIGVAETIDAIRLSRLGVALLGRQTVENALELCFYVFSAGYVAHGDMITTKNLKGKMVIHSLSKTNFRNKKDEDNYLFFMILLALLMTTCEGQRERERERRRPEAARPCTDRRTRRKRHGRDRQARAEAERPAALR